MRQAIVALLLALAGTAVADELAEPCASEINDQRRLHYTSSINRTQGNPNYRPLEAKLQISLRAKVARDLFLPGADLWFAYTQQSLWQLWNRAESSPFRSTDHQPEAIYVLPVPPDLAALPFGWRTRMLQLGLVHQSNGQGDPLSRSWNRVYLGLGLENGPFSLQIRANQRLKTQGQDDNPALTDYLGRTEISLLWSAAPTSLRLTRRTNLNPMHNGSWQLDLTHPVFADKPTGLRWYAQFFSGYGETLLDYNHRQNSIGLGLALFQL